MKKLIFYFLLLASFSAFAQDSTKIKGLQLQAKLIEYLTSNMTNTDNDSLYQVYLDLRPKFRVINPPTGVTLVTLDSIPTVELANLYQYTMSNSEGLSMANNMKNQIASIRVTNSFLDRLCSAFENTWLDRLLTLRLGGRKLLRGK